jgi:hypothetical protein
VQYAIKVDNKDYNPQMLVGPQGQVEVVIYKNAKKYFGFFAQNMSGDTVSGDSENIKFLMFSDISPEWCSNSYCARGVRVDGMGHTYGTIKELFKDYADKIKETSSTVVTPTGEEYPGIQFGIYLEKDNIHISVSAGFKSEDGSCVSMFFFVY